MATSIIYITGNEGKYKTAVKFLEKYSIEVIQKQISVHEIQSSSIEEISRDKAHKAFAEVGQPLIVNDTGWYIEALNGFPGSYMAYINKWLGAEDMLALMSRHTNRTVTMKQTITYIDEKTVKTFEYDSHGIVLPEARGSKGNMVDKIMSLSQDGLSIAQEKDKGNYEFEFEKLLWEEVGTWLKNK